MKNGKLEVGDKLAYTEYYAWRRERKALCSVARLTKTRAITNNNINIINKIIDDNAFKEYGKGWNGAIFTIATEEDIQEVKKQNYIDKCYAWFRDMKNNFSDVDIVKIYEMFNKNQED